MRVAIAGLVAAQSMIFGLAVNLSPPSGAMRLGIHLVMAGLAVAVFVLAGLPILRQAWGALCQGRIVVEQLFIAGILGAFAASVHSTLTGVGHVYYEVVAVLVAIYTFGSLLGEQRKRAVVRAAEQLRRDFDHCERIGSNGGIERLPVEAVEVGDRILIAAGAPITVDGRILEGESNVRETALTGEPTPVVRRPGDPVLAGSYCLDGSLIVEAASDGRNRDLDRLLQHVQEATRSKSRIECVADRLAAWFLPIVLFTSLAVFAIWTLRESWLVGLFNGLAVLLVACPCSLGLATPIGIWAALSNLARRGLVAHRSDLVEVLARADVVVFDKTGTLSGERMVVRDFVTASGVDREGLRRQIAAIERESTHPIAAAFREHGSERTATEVVALPAVGIAGCVDGQRLEIGNASLDGREFEVLRARLRHPEKGGHEVRIRRNGTPVAVALLTEQLRGEAGRALQDLARLGVAVEVMTGDRPEAAARLNLPNVTAGMSPSEKATRVRELRQSGRTVVFVGDGINDAPAMAEADAPIAIGSGSGLARETAWAELPGAHLPAIAESIRTSRSTLKAIRRNILFAACYNLIGITLAATGILHPVAAALLMLGSSLTVTWNALRQGGGERSPEPRARPTLPLATLRQQALPALLGALLAVQGPIIATLGGFGRTQTALFVLLFLSAGGALFLLASRFERDPLARMSLTMFSLGGLGMLTGWWVDAGFAPVVRDGICLCGCAASILGAGLVSKLNWMNAGMLASAIPMYFEVDPRFRSARSRLGCWAGGLIGMFVGMELAGLAMMLIPVASHPQLHFFATYAAMLTGMTLGMVVACQVAQRWVLRSDARASTLPPASGGPAPAAAQRSS